ncbi:tetratricopeptide repeat protein, partial [Candidatus Zixiibacteriota bacterium]
EAYKYYFTGREAAFRMHNQEAIGNFQEAVALDSTFIEAYDALARQYYFIGETEAALQVIERVKSFSYKLTEEKLLEILSLEALLREDWELAVTYLNRLINSHPENMKAHIDLGMVYYQRKLMYDEGISEFKKALKLDPQGVSHRTGFVYNVLGYAYFRKGERDKALEAFEKYVSLLPNQAYPLTSIGDFYCMVGEYDASLLRLAQAVEIKPDYSLPYIYLGHTYLEKGMYSLAQDSYEKSLQLSISDAQKGAIYSYLGNLHFLSGEYDQAIGWCQQALDLNPQMIEAHWTLGRIYATSGILAEAEDEVRKIKRLVEQTQTEEMKKYYHHLMGELNLSKDFFQEAVESFHRAAEIKSLEPAFYQSAVAMGYYRAGKLSRAMEQLESVLRINPNYVPAHYLLGVIHEQEGREAEARHHFAEYLRIWENADEDLPQFVEVKKRIEEL